MAVSFYDQEMMDELVRLVKKNPDAPVWFGRVMELLSANQHLLVPREDAERYVVEFVYPH